MQINVSQQLRAYIGEVREYDTSGAVKIDNTSVEMAGNVRLTRTDKGILVQGRIEGEYELTCGRCLSEFNHILNLRIEEIYYPTTDTYTGAAIDIPDEPGCFTIDENNILDLTDAVSQYVLMSIPIKPLCMNECAGLCPTCGTNLNNETCDCPATSVDSRWDALREMVGIDSDMPVKDRKGS